jgi:hypothetical protein
MPKPDYHTIEGIKLHPLFLFLTAKQQVFLTHYLATQNRIEASRKAYGEKTPELISLRTLRSSVVRQLIAIYYGFDPDCVPVSRVEVVGLITKRLRDPDLDDKLFVRLLDHLLNLKVNRPKGLKYKKAQDPIADAVMEVPEQPGEDITDESIDQLVKRLEAERKEKQNGQLNSERQEESQGQETNGSGPGQEGII